jgi:thiosulfate reductase cytochrome b subunit
MEQKRIRGNQVLRYDFRERFDALVRGAVLRLLDADRARVLVDLAVLDRSCAGRWTDLAHAASVGRTVFFYAVMRMYGYWASQMRTSDLDKQWWKSLRHYVRNEDDQMPPAGRYNAGQKALFWSFFYAAVALLLTGVVLWFPESIPWNLRWLRYVSIFLHPVAALFTIANFLIHIYMSVFCRARRVRFGDSRRCFLGVRQTITIRNGIAKLSGKRKRLIPRNDRQL